jgi:hypothetical protein
MVTVGPFINIEDLGFHLPSSLHHMLLGRSVWWWGQGMSLLLLAVSSEGELGPHLSHIQS